MKIIETAIRRMIDDRRSNEEKMLLADKAISVRIVLGTSASGTRILDLADIGLEPLGEVIADTTVRRLRQANDNLECKIKKMAVSIGLEV